MLEGIHGQGAEGGSADGAEGLHRPAQPRIQGELTERENTHMKSDTMNLINFHVYSF